MLSQHSFNDFIKSSKEDKIYDCTIDNKCSRCGGCCTKFLYLSWKEKRAINNYVKSHNIKPTVHTFVSNENLTIDFTCPFLDDSAEVTKCKIYEVRPKICREFICNNSEKAKTLRESIKENRALTNLRSYFYNDGFSSFIDDLLFRR